MAEAGSIAMPMGIGEVISKRRKKVVVKRNTCALLMKIVVIASAGYMLMTMVFGAGVVEGEGMYPRMRDGDLAIYYRLEKEYDIGAVVVYTAEDKKQYGRIVARGGDTVDINEAGQLLVNGSVQQEEIFFETTSEGRQTEFPITLNDKEVFVLGDNRTAAVDSRDYGAIKEADILGKVITLLRRRGL